MDTLNNINWKFWTWLEEDIIITSDEVAPGVQDPIISKGTLLKIIYFRLATKLSKGFESYSRPKIK